VAGASEAECEQAKHDEERFIDDLIERGEAVPEGEELPPGATHVVVTEETDEGPQRKVRRKRFSAF